MARRKPAMTIEEFKKLALWLESLRDKMEASVVRLKITMTAENEVYVRGQLAYHEAQVQTLTWVIGLAGLAVKSKQAAAARKSAREAEDQTQQPDEWEGA